jgi:hypothetical protein
MNRARFQGGRPVGDTLSLTHDAGPEQVAVFGPASKAKKCCDRPDCDDVKIHDASGEHIATVHNGSRYHFLSSDNGLLGVFKAARAATGDARFRHDHAAGIAAINQRNAEFWKNKEEEPQ